MTIKRFMTRAALCAFAMTAATGFTACSDDETTSDNNNKPDTTKPGAYVIPVSSDDATYLLTAQSLDKDTTISVVGQGYESVSASYWIFKNDELFGLVYNQGNAGTGASYYLNSQGQLEKDLEYTMSRFSTAGTFGDHIITVSTGNSTTTDAAGNVAQALLINHLNTLDGSKTESSIVAENMLGNGEKVTLSGILETGGKLYTSAVPMGMSKYGIAQWPDKVLSDTLITQADGGSASSSYEAGTIPRTQHPDRAYVAIYADGDLTKRPLKVIETDKIGYATGRYRSQYFQTIWAADNGDIYIFSPGHGRTQRSTADLKCVTGKLPSGVVRIKAGTDTFDPDYYVNLEAIGTKHPLFRCWHIKGDYFLLQLYKKGLDDMINGGLKADVSEYAIFHANEKTITTVTGLPTDASTATGVVPYAEDGSIYLAFNSSTGSSAFYKINPETATATKRLSVSSNGTISTVGRLGYKAK